ncbi:chlorite dismutase [Symbiobacterium terraclitae]|uniref:Coproheme decarboxylase n=1 Tax=Symbiobacterium terraclitae TaxID=557451 RepID=A0ABS4JWD6_9FIRM|nr:hydrogen peroxide-dependent heme synthase [Symbiobacterium terraclitae]MBP2019833.1 chlorite dismutase [Symbiobacterium terraclitae]
MAEAPGTLEGWFVLHDFRRIDWAAWNRLSEGQKEEAIAEAEAFLKAAEAVSDAPEGSSAAYAIIGHKSDLLLLHLRPDLEALQALESGFSRTALGSLTNQPYSYFSVTELSLYEASARGGSTDPEELLKNPAIVRRLKLQVPDHPYICFYPMNKRRGETVNWYTAPIEARRAMMRQHGETGRKYAEQITQMVTGSTGLDDWEWGVTLFAREVLPIKKLVYEMRFDEVSARYAEFGPFQVGRRVAPGDLAGVLLGR